MPLMKDKKCQKLFEAMYKPYSNREVKKLIKEHNKAFQEKAQENKKENFNEKEMRIKNQKIMDNTR